MNFKPIIRAVKKYAPIALSVLAGVGTVVTVVEAVQEVPEAKKLLEEATEEKGDELTIIEKAKIITPACKKTLIFGTAALACGGGSTAIMWRRTKDLTAALNREHHLLQRYTEAVTATAGLEGTNLVSKYMAEQDRCKIPDDNPDEDGKILVYDEYTQGWFRASESDIYWAFYYSLGAFTEHYECKMSTLYNSMGCKLPKQFDKYGWAYDEDWEEEWQESASTIEFYLSDKKTLDDGLEYYVLYYGKPPRFYPDF